MTNNIIKKYDAGEITIIWQPGLCQHSGVCTKMLPAVYNPAKKPWITPNAATTSQLREQLKACPSGALSYEENT